MRQIDNYGRNGPRMAVVFSRFPVWNQNFAVGDFIELDRAGFHIEIFTLLGQSGRFVQPEAETFRGRIHRSRFSLSFLRANLKAWCRPCTWRLLRQVVGGVGRARPKEMLKTYFLFSQAVYFAHLMKLLRIQHIHAAWASYPATVAWIASELTGIPFSFSSHAYDIYMVQSLLREKIERARFVVTCAESNRGALIKVGGKSAGSKIHVHRHGTDLQRFRPVMQTVPGSNAVWQILACGFLAAYKGFENLVGACALLRDQGWKFQCSIIGQGPQYKNLSRQIEENGLSQQVRIIPPIPQVKLVEHYHKADVFVHPSIVTKRGNQDVIPNVLVEAMASGTPVISTNLNSIQELIQDGKNGVLVDPGNPPALAEAIVSVMHDDVKREQFVVAARQSVAELFDRRKNAVGLIQTFVAHTAGMANDTDK